MSTPDTIDDHALRQEAKATFETLREHVYSLLSDHNASAIYAVNSAFHDTMENSRLAEHEERQRIYSATLRAVRVLKAIAEDGIAGKGVDLDALLHFPDISRHGDMEETIARPIKDFAKKLPKAPHKTAPRPSHVERVGHPSPSILPGP